MAKVDIFLSLISLSAFEQVGFFASEDIIFPCLLTAFVAVLIINRNNSAKKGHPNVYCLPLHPEISRVQTPS